MGSNVVVAKAQHCDRFGLGSSIMTIPPDAPIEGMELANVDVAIFREADIR
jgi:hypothetical protein